MIYYVLADCSGSLPNINTGSDLSSINVGQVFQSSQYPGVCLELIDVLDVLFPPPLEPITPTSIFDTCPECLGAELGCTDPIACNYNPCATVDDGSCTYNNVTIRILCNEPITTCNINANCN